MDRRDVLGWLLAGAGGAAWSNAAGATPGPEKRALRLVTTHLPPLVLEKGGRGGALQDVVHELCKRLGLKPETDFVPWPRALFLAATMPATAIYPLTRIAEREGQFRWLAPLYDERYVFVAPRGGAFDVRDPGAMKERRIAMLRGAGQIAMLRELGYNRFVEAHSIEDVHRFLLGGMADASFGERNIINASLKSRGALRDFALSAPVRTSTAWLGGSRDFPEADALAFQRAMATMRADGSYQRILGRYGLS